MKKILYLIVLQIIVCNCFSQETFNIKGKFEADSTLIKYVAIKLFQDSIQKQATITNEKGIFEFKNIAKGEYKVKIVSIFYEEKELAVNLLNNIDLGVIKLTDQPIMLSEVEVLADVKPVEHTDNGVILNVSDTKLNKYRDALSLINFAPVTFINNHNVQFESGGLEILINGKPVNIPVNQQDKFLQSISAENIVRIEIVDKPDASLSGNKYGSVNIILKQNKGLSGSVEAKLMYQKTFAQSYYASLFYNSEKLRMYSLFNIDIRQFEYESKGFEFRDSLYIENEATQTFDVITPDIVLGADYKINNKSSLGFLYSFLYENNRHQKSSSKYNFIDLNDSLISSETDNISKYFLHTFTLSYNLITDSLGSNFSTSFNYSPSLSKGNNFNNFSFYQSSTDSTPIQKIDYKYNSLYHNNIFGYDAKHTQIFKNKSSLNFGLKLTYTDYNNGWDAYNLQNDEYKLDENSSYNLNFNEYLAAIFVAYRFSYKKSTFSLSLRGEYNYNKYKNNNSNYSFSDNYAILPTFMHNININGENRIYYYFTQRIYRPNFNYYIENSTYNPISQSYGNSNIKPQNQYVFALGYILKNNYTFSLQALRSTNLFLSIPEIKDNLVIYNRINGGFSNQIAINANLPINIFEWWETTTNISGAFVNLDFTNNSNRYFSNSFWWNFSHTSDFSVTDRLWLSVDYTYTSKTKTFFKETAGYHNLEAGIGYVFDNLRIYFNVSDILNNITTNTKYNYFDIIYGESNYRQITSRTFRIGIAYDFSIGKKYNNFNTRQSDIETEKQRMQAK